MTTSNTQISILFGPLLSTITECLQLPQTEYNILDHSLHKVSITVRSISGTIDGVYVGGPSTTNEDAFEQAAKEAISHLKVLYDIYVKDVTAIRNQDSERNLNLWRLKRQELERMVKGLPKLEAPEEFTCPEISHLHFVTIDFVSLLSAFRSKIPVNCSDMEVVEHAPATFTAWLTITHHKSTYGCTSIYGGGSAKSIEDSSELAAQRAVRDMIQKFKIIVEDFTYHHEQETERCCRLYRLKRIELEQIAQRSTLTELEETVPISPQGYIHFHLDYMSILRKIFTTITIRCTKLQTVEHYPGSYTSWITIETPNRYPTNQKLIGPRSTTLNLAKDHLAKKAINFLIPAYNLKMIDANYESVGSKSTEIMLELERGSFLTTRALVFGRDEEPLLSSLIEEEDGLSIEGVISYTPPAHLQLSQSEPSKLPRHPSVSVARRVLSFEDA